MDRDESSLHKVVEEQLASQFGWDLNLFHGAPFELPGLGLRMRAEYALVNPGLFPPGSVRLSHLQLTKWLKFGNSVEQLHHLFYLAKTYNVNQIVLPPSTLFQARALGEFSVTTAGGDDSAKLGLGLAGLFYYLEPFCLKRPTESLLESARRYVKPLLSGTLQETDPCVSKDDLVLHFRAGDVFRHPVAHYGQPPLAYYLAAIERERPDRVWLVFEDRANPCIDAAEAWLRKHGIEVAVQSGSLVEDLRILLSAHRLVIGQGTFGSSVAMLSTHLCRLYTFRSESWDDLRLPGVEVVRGIDVLGRYTKALLSQNWTASPEQRELMLSYSVNALRFESTCSPEG